MKKSTEGKLIMAVSVLVATQDLVIAVMLRMNGMGWQAWAQIVLAAASFAGGVACGVKADWYAEKGK